MKPLAEWFWTDRWDGSSAALLPMEARGLYREMLTQAWRRDGRLPNSPEAIKRAVRCTDAEWDRCWPLVRPYWRESDGWLTNDTQVEVLVETKRQMEARSNRGAAAARKRWQCSSNAQALPKHMLTQSPSNALRSPDLDLSLTPDQDQKIPSESPSSPTVTPVTKRKTDPLILDLKNRLGSGVRICGDQIRALRGAGWDDSRIQAAIAEFAEPGMAPWEWTKRARGVVPTGGGFKTNADRADETLRILTGGGS